MKQDVTIEQLAKRGAEEGSAYGEADIIVPQDVTQDANAPFHFDNNSPVIVGSNSASQSQKKNQGNDTGTVFSINYTLMFILIGVQCASVTTVFFAGFIFVLVQSRMFEFN